MRAARAAALAATLGLLAATARGQGAGTGEVLGATAGGRNVMTPNAVAPGMAPMSGPVDPAEYVLGPGDLLQVNLGGGLTRTWDAMILPEGTLYVPGVGSIALAGVTLLAARDAVLQRVAREYRGVTVDLRLVRARTFLVQLVGETTRPGPLEVSAASRAGEVLVDGLFNGAASRRNVEIRRRAPQGEQRIPLDLTRFRLLGVRGADPLLREGDVLFFPRVVAEAWIEGAVVRSGRFDLTPGDSLSDLLELAGGLLPMAMDRAVLVRFQGAEQRDSLSFDVSAVTAGRFDTALRNGDHVFVYSLPRYHFLEQAGLFGEVQRPGTYPLLPGLARLSDLVRSAGGFLPEADLTSLRVFRAAPGTGDPDPELDRLLQLGRGELSESEYQALRARAAARRPEFRLDWTRVKPGDDMDLVLRGGDVVRVDRLVATVRVEGEVLQPGLIHHEPGRRLEEYVQLAGGYGNRAVRSKSTIKRAVTGQTILARDVDAIQPGDLIWVPEKGDPRGWQNLQSVLLVAAQVATIILAIRAF